MDDLIPMLMFCGELYCPGYLAHSYVFFLSDHEMLFFFSLLSQVDFVAIPLLSSFEMDLENSSSIVIATVLI